MIFNSYKYFSNRRCEYYPCHDVDTINCLFCFCPLYSYKNCGGDYTTTKDGLKDCSTCKLPHIPGNYDFIIRKIKEGR